MKDSQNLTDEEFKLMINLLKRYSENDMDQWEMWRFHSEQRGGPICVAITLGPDPDCDLSHYDDLARYID